MTPVSRRALLATLAAGSLIADESWGADLVSSTAAEPFSYERLKALAKARAAAPYAPPVARKIPALAALDYDAIGQVRFRPEKALWAGTDVAVQFFPLQAHATTPITVHVVKDGVSRPLRYSPSLFSSPSKSPFRAVPGDAGFAGFRVMNADGKTDWLAVMGASYFRSSSPMNQYGMSARGLAIDTTAKKPEEFPVFSAFWLERDTTGRLIIYALLDSPSVSGAYRLVHERRGGVLVQEVESALYFRADIEQLGVAPLTSMFWYGEDHSLPPEDWRPEIHDSDGLALWTGRGERLWRPLANEPRVVTTTFSDENPKGFGLIQRDRNFDHYQDDGVFYDRRPGLWVEPLGDWGKGAVTLVEIPTHAETDDNIVAFWTPAEPMKAGHALDLRYRLHWTADVPIAARVAKVIATRTGRAGRPGQKPVPPGRRYAIDFQGEVLEGLDRGSGVEPMASGHGVTFSNISAYPVVGLPGVWRLIFDAAKTGTADADLRAYLRQGDHALTETWTSLYT